MAPKALSVGLRGRVRLAPRPERTRPTTEGSEPRASTALVVEVVGRTGPGAGPPAAGVPGPRRRRRSAPGRGQGRRHGRAQRQRDGASGTAHRYMVTEKRAVTKSGRRGCSPLRGPNRPVRPGPAIPALARL